MLRNETQATFENCLNNLYREFFHQLTKQEGDVEEALEKGYVFDAVEGIRTRNGHLAIRLTVGNIDKVIPQRDDNA